MRHIAWRLVFELAVDLSKVVIFSVSYQFCHLWLFGPTPTWESIVIAAVAGILFLKSEYTHARKLTSMSPYKLFLDDERRPKDIYAGVEISEQGYGGSYTYRSDPHPGAPSDPAPGREWIVCGSVEQFKETVKERGIPSFVSYDYDLSGPGTGADAARWLTQQLNGASHPDYRCHSSSGSGAKEIEDVI